MFIIKQLREIIRQLNKKLNVDTPMTIAATHLPSSPSHYSDYTVKWATLNWEIEQAMELRKKVFCHEQNIFSDSDRDEIDDCAQVLVAIANRGGWHEKIVGTVRIHRQEENVWWGSRLAVEKPFRTQTGLGSTLIKLAVSSAHALGCTQFLAQVQKQNEPLFKRLNWTSRYELEVKSRPHVMMEAQLSMFPPCLHPKSGFVIRNNTATKNVVLESPWLVSPNKVKAIPNKHREHKEPIVKEIGKYHAVR